MITGGAALVLIALGMVFVNVQVAGTPNVSGPPPADETLKLTVPEMQRVKNVPVYTTTADDEASLNAGAIHVEGTGFPWEAGSNVYIAGHRLGYPNTGSFLLFYDLNKLENGDRVVLKDAKGRKYIYQVFDELVVDPGEYYVTEPVAGKNVVSLQACTLPDYSRRIIVQAELVRVVEQPAQASAAGQA